MNKTLKVRYGLFTLTFALIAVGLVSHSYLWLATLAVVAIGLAVIGEQIETAPTVPYRQYNELHHRKGH
ncbi:hypothetical protein D2Q93_02905 [Alicyclobacillaceae bacterium I2511]|nr:hypothetical protein D2Q93_02905 [Alicyclobacillaceae bacterium I2511]